MSQPDPLTEQQLDEIDIRAEGIASQLSGWLDRFAPLAGEERIDRARNVLTEDVPALLAEVRRQRTKTRTLGELAARRESELIARRAELEHVRRIARRLAAHAVGFGDVLDESDRGPWAKTVGADIAELSAALSPDATPEATSAPLAASQPSEAPVEPETATEAPTGLLGDSGADVDEQSAAETAIGSITIRSESVQLDNGECLRDLSVGDSVELRPDTGHEGLWIAAAFHGDYQEQVTLQYAEVVEDCGNDPVIACKFSGTRHAHPVDLDGKVRPRPTP